MLGSRHDNDMGIILDCLEHLAHINIQLGALFYDVLNVMGTWMGHGQVDNGIGGA